MLECTITRCWRVQHAGPVAEQVLLLENIGTSLKVGPSQLPSLHKLLLQAATTLQMDNTPDLYIRQHPVPNAYTLAIAGRKPFVVVHTALLELLEPNEVQVTPGHGALNATFTCLFSMHAMPSWAMCTWQQ